MEEDEEDAPHTAPSSPRTAVTPIQCPLYNSNDEEEEEFSSEADDDNVQCTYCYRVFPRDRWLDWPVVPGYETVCAPCTSTIMER